MHIKEAKLNSKDFNKIDNVTLVRGENIPDGMYHLVGEIIVKHKDGTYLLMQRDYKKHLEKLVSECDTDLVEIADMYLHDEMELDG